MYMLCPAIYVRFVDKPGSIVEEDAGAVECPPVEVNIRQISVCCC